MAGLTTLGVFHTAISVVALVGGCVAIARHRRISPIDRSGQLYLFATLLSALTGLGIFQHSGFGPPHALSILTLLALGLGLVASYSVLFGAWSRYVEAIAYTTTILFHMIPGFTESLTRLPTDAPILPSADAPQFKVIYGILLVVFVVGLVVQLRWLRSTRPAT